MVVSKGVKVTAVLAIVVVTVVLIAYFVFQFESYKNSTHLFAVEDPVPDESLNVFYPTGEVIPLTDEEIAERNTLINNLLTESS